MGLLTILQRWRHRGGYGVHSPSAFTFVNDVINLPDYYAYYGYRALPASKDFDARLLFRLVAALAPSTISIVAETDEQAQTVLKIACRANSATRVAKHGEKADMLVCLTNSRPAENDWKNAYFSNKNNSSLKQKTKAATTGHLFKGRRRAIFVDSNAPFQIIDVHI